MGRTVADFGGVDGLCNVGAALSAEGLGSDHDLLEMDPERWRRTLEVKLVGYALAGIIVNTSSGTSLGRNARQPRLRGLQVGVNSLTRHIAKRWGKEGIRCNALAPGLVVGETRKKQIDKALEVALSLCLGRPLTWPVPLPFSFPTTRSGSTDRRGRSTEA